MNKRKIPFFKSQLEEINEESKAVSQAYKHLKYVSQLCENSKTFSVRLDNYDLTIKTLEKHFLDLQNLKLDIKEQLKRFSSKLNSN